MRCVAWRSTAHRKRAGGARLNGDERLHDGTHASALSGNHLGAHARRRIEVRDGARRHVLVSWRIHLVLRGQVDPHLLVRRACGAL